jgi:hypothetical protein
MGSHNGSIDTIHTPPPPLSFYNNFKAWHEINALRSSGIILLRITFSLSYKKGQKLIIFCNISAIVAKVRCDTWEKLSIHQHFTLLKEIRRSWLMMKVSLNQRNIHMKLQKNQQWQPLNL